MMSTTERLRRSCSAPRRTAFATSYRLTDHDPTAHRHAVEIDATVRVSGGELRARACRLRTLSLGGALVELDRIPVGTLINITFGLPAVEERLSLDAVVRWCTPEGVSVLFDSLRAWEVWVLWRFLASLDDDEDDLEPTNPTLAIRPVDRGERPLELLMEAPAELPAELSVELALQPIEDDADDPGAPADLSDLNDLNDLNEVTRLYAVASR